MKNFLSIWEYLQEKSIDLGLAILVIVITILLGRGFYFLTKKVLAERIRASLMWILLVDVFWIFCMLGGVALAVQIAFGVNITRHIFLSAGILSVGAGFAFRGVGENFVAGFVLALRPPFVIGDFIEYRDSVGRVCEIGLRAMRIITPDGKEVYIPSANLINNKYANLTFMGLLRYDFDLPLAPEFDLQQLEKLLIDVISVTEGVVPKERREPSMHIMEAKSRYMVVAKVFFWINTHEYPTVTEHSYIRSRVIYNVLKALREQGIQLTSDTYHVQMGSLNAATSSMLPVQISESKPQ